MTIVGMFMADGGAFPTARADRAPGPRLRLGAGGGAFRTAGRRVSELYGSGASKQQYSYHRCHYHHHRTYQYGSEPALTVSPGTRDARAGSELRYGVLQSLGIGAWQDEAVGLQRVSDLQHQRRRAPRRGGALGRIHRDDLGPGDDGTYGASRLQHRDADLVDHQTETRHGEWPTRILGEQVGIPYAHLVSRCRGK